MKSAAAALLVLPLACAAQDGASFDDVLTDSGLPSETAAPFSEWDGVTELFRDQALELVGEFALPDSAPEGLSGIAWTSNPGHPCHPDAPQAPDFDLCGPDSYVLCEDSGAWLDYAEIGVDRRSGAVTSAVFRLRSQAYFCFAKREADFEAIAYAPSRHGHTHHQLYVADESSPSIWQDRLRPCTTGLVAFPSPIIPVPLPKPLRTHRPNKGIEAMCLSPDDRSLWLATEDAIPADGPAATTEHGALVRLFQMDAFGDPAKYGRGLGLPRQWFYPLDPATGSGLPQLPAPFNGLAELCALPDGRLLALERCFGAEPRGPADPRASLIRISLYLVDPLGELDNAAAEDGTPAQPLRKRLLWRGLAGRANYEGMTLGPELADGSRALLLVSDGDVSRKGTLAFPWSKRLLSFRLRFPAVER